jgi:hypothetical protein
MKYCVIKKYASVSHITFDRNISGSQFAFVVKVNEMLEDARPSLPRGRT